MQQKKGPGRARVYESDADRQAAYRERVKKSGGKFMSAPLSPEAVQAVKVLRKHWRVDEHEAIERALLVCAKLAEG